LLLNIRRSNVEIKITKKTIIYGLFIIAIYGVSCFLAGQYSRLDRTSGTSQQLIDGVILTGDTADRVLDELGIGRHAGQSAADYGYAIAEGVRKLSKSDEKQRILIDAIRREINDTTENAKVINESFTNVSDAVDYGWDIILKEARAYERIANSTLEFDKNSDENGEKSE
jgi:hypothetical protein